MAEIRLTRIEQGQTRIRNVPIAVTPEGFWCCPSPVVFQKSTKTHNKIPRHHHPASKKQIPSQKKPASHEQPPPPPPGPPPSLVPVPVSGSSDDQKDPPPAVVTNISTQISDNRTNRSKVENVPRKVSIELGEPGTSDLQVLLLGKQTFAVKLCVHKNVLLEKSGFFLDKLSEQQQQQHQPSSSSLEIDDCEDIEIYVETVGLMYCKDLRLQLMKQNVSRVLRILKVAELLRFKCCINSCLEYLEAVPWVGDEEEEKVVTSVLRLREEGIGVTPILKRVASENIDPPKDTIAHIIDLVLKSSEERGRREMKAIVLKLLRENNATSSSSGLSDVYTQTIYSSCKSCLSSLLNQFRHAEVVDKKQIGLDVDNLTWLLEILADRQAADEFAIMWANQEELAKLHDIVPVVTRNRVSCITARLFVGIGRGELLPAKETRHLLLERWLQPLIDDYSWLQHGCRSFDSKAVEEGIGRTILTLPLEDQQSILLAWLGSFLKAGDNCPNLQKAFEVWWRRTFVKPYA